MMVRIPHLNAQENDDVGVLELIDHLRRPRVVQEVYVLEPAPRFYMSETGHTMA